MKKIDAVMRVRDSRIKRLQYTMNAGIVSLFFAILPVVAMTVAQAQPMPVEDSAAQDEEVTVESDTPIAPVKVDVDPQANDDEIAERLTAILGATDWFVEPAVHVEEGVVFLSGRTMKPESREWAGRLAGNTQDVVAVVNRIRVIEGDWWDLTPAWAELRSLGREAVQGAPLFLLALLLLAVTWLAARTSIRLAQRLFEKRIGNRLLQQVIARVVSIPVFLMGLYLVLRVSGLTQMAATVVGGTGLVGLVIGIAFRDIAENFLASILISMQRPFAIGDLIDVDNQKGYVQGVTTRGTLLMTLDGNHVQIPNSTIYKATIQNFTANPKMRQDFGVGIGYDDPISTAQQTAMKILTHHPVVLSDPEPWVLVESLGAATVNLRIYFWIDGNVHSPLKVRSSVIRQVKGAFDQAGVSMPDEAREVVFPQDVPVRMIQEKDADDGAQMDRPLTKSRRAVVSAEEEAVSTPAEGGLGSEAGEICEQARQSRSPDAGANLLEGPSPAS